MTDDQSRLLHVGAAGAAAGFLYLCFENSALQTIRISVQSPRLPSGFDGFRIVHLSDTHSSSFGRNNRRLLYRVRKLHPDCIAYTGDLLDSYHPDVALSQHLITELSSIAPVFYCPGNHEGRMPKAYARTRSIMRSCGVTVLENDTVLLERKGDKIALSGTLDPRFYKAGFSRRKASAAMRKSLSSLPREPGCYAILLSHRPEFLSLYVQAGFDLVLSGHAHGGQIRLHGTDGLFAPSQGILPHYTSGLYREGKTAMVVSRGLCVRPYLPRVHNRPEIIEITLCR